MPPIGIVWLQLMAEVPCCYRFISLALTELTELKSVTSTCPICDTALFAHDNTTHLARLTCLTHGHLTACPAGRVLRGDVGGFELFRDEEAGERREG
jgi:hypothetical protein